MLGIFCASLRLGFVDKTCCWFLGSLNEGQIQLPASSHGRHISFLLFNVCSRRE
jgi:hypothetical protein